jgi:hypothetical protein
MGLLVQSVMGHPHVMEWTRKRSDVEVATVVMLAMVLVVSEANRMYNAETFAFL